MGTICCKPSDRESDIDLAEIKVCLTQLLKQVPPEQLLILALDDREVLELCRDNPDLRQGVIVAAVRKYHTEKFFYEDVHKRTANYMVILDKFLEIQDNYEREVHLQDLRSSKGGFFTRWFRRNRSRDEKDAGNGCAPESDTDRK